MAGAKERRFRMQTVSTTVDVDIDEDLLEENGYHHEDDCPGGGPDEDDFAGQDTLPAEFPAPVMTADILIKRSIEESLSQYAYFTETLKGRRDEDDAAKERSILKGNMHLFSSLLDSVIVDLLQQIQGVNRTWADKAAAHLDDALEGGEYYPEMIWEWAAGRGLDPDAITETARSKFAEKETK